MNSDVFKEELEMIQNGQIRQMVREYFDMAVQKYFFEIPASTTGKYHPKIDLGKGGLVRHTKMCVRVAVELLGLRMFSKMDADLAIAALLIHDSQKCGDGEKYSRHDHPLLAADKFSKHAMKYPEYPDVQLQIDSICRMVSSHMGQWTTNAYSNVVLPIPQQADEKFVHLCDFIASKKFIGSFDYEMN